MRACFTSGDARAPLASQQAGQQRGSPSRWLPRVTAPACGSACLGPELPLPAGRSPGGVRPHTLIILHQSPPPSHQLHRALALPDHRAVERWWGRCYLSSAAICLSSFITSATSNSILVHALHSLQSPSTSTVSYEMQDCSGSWAG